MFRSRLPSLQPGSLPGLLEVGSFEGAERTVFSNWLFPLSAAALLVAISAPAKQFVAPQQDDLRSQALAATPPLPPATILKPLTREQAIAVNRTIPFAIKASALADPFTFAGDDTSRLRSEDCLTAAVYYEAGGESVEGQEAVAQVVLNRVRHPAFPATVCGVIFQGSTLRTGCQFTFTCDGSLNRAPDRRRWAAAQAVARAALNGQIFPAVGLSTHYHANYVVPYWAVSLDKTAQIGAHLFYRWPARWGTPAAFSRRYKGAEVDPTMLEAAALMARGKWPQNLRPSADPSIQFATDARVELLGALGSLTLPPSRGLGSYGNDARAFVQETPDEAVRTSMIDLIAAGDPATLNRRVRTLAKDSSFAGFYDSQRRGFRNEIARAETDANAAVQGWQAYTAMPVAPFKLTLAFAARDPSSQCIASKLMDGRLVFLALAGGTERRTGDSILGSSALARNLFAGQGWDAEAKSALARAKVIAPDVESEIALAVMARIDALSAGEEAGRASAVRSLSDGYRLVPALAMALKGFERDRSRYRTLSEFLPVLLERAILEDFIRTDAVSTPPDCSAPLAAAQPAPASGPVADASAPSHVSAAAGLPSSMTIVPR